MHRVERAPIIKDVYIILAVVEETTVFVFLYRTESRLQMQMRFINVLRLYCNTRLRVQK